MIWISLLAFIVGAGIQDLKSRRVSNLYNAVALGYFVGIHIYQHTWKLSIIGGVAIAILFFLPTWKGVWGVGDWKTGIVIGSAVGLFPAIAIWTISFVLFPMKTWTYKWSRKYMSDEKAKLIPLATLMSVSSFITFALVEFIQYAI